jgi:hypothetical protein
MIHHIRTTSQPKCDVKAIKTFKASYQPTRKTKASQSTLTSKPFLRYHQVINPISVRVVTILVMLSLIKLIMPAPPMLKLSLLLPHTLRKIRTNSAHGSTQHRSHGSVVPEFTAEQASDERTEYRRTDIFAFFQCLTEP